MGNDNDDNVYVIQLYHPSHTSCIGLKVLEPWKKFFPVRNCKSPPPSRLAAGRVGGRRVGAYPAPARSAANWSSALHGSAGVISDGS